MYCIRNKESGSNKYVIAAEVSDRLASTITFQCNGKWRTFNGKRAFEFAEDSVFGVDGTLSIYLWAGSLMVEE